MPLKLVDSELDDRERRRRIHSGVIFKFSATPGTNALTDLARQMLKQAFAPNNPRRAHESLTALQVSSAFSSFRHAFIDHPDCRRLVTLIMQERGVNLENVYIDEPEIKGRFPKLFHGCGRTFAIVTGRDSWFSSTLSQINWWLPVYSPEPGTADMNIDLVPPPGGITAFFGDPYIGAPDRKTEGVATFDLIIRTIHIDDAVAHVHSWIGTTLEGYECAADPSRLLTDEVKGLSGGFRRFGKVLRSRGRPGPRS
ncbi:hypothetical protein [Allomesorhizobium camelthorni]|uniref:Uncharacterized protein n=1 Tax=Allomesorhizobium camelthorni TaxID=475069 RepID=A0A6G4WDP1_9HYPH|nr:hypothetical protein [Mesorhizobium camelthorni]NGO52925.1 hypothetical protein [Mesorhizobium camelthorni]